MASPSILHLYRAVADWLNSSHRRSETWLITKGHILKPPFSIRYQEQSGLLVLTILGTNDAVTIKCNRVVTSKYRPGQLGLFIVDRDGVLQEKRFVVGFTEAHQKVLYAFRRGEEFTSEELYRRVKRVDGKTQIHARRRWKELKYNFGFDVDFDISKNRYYRGMAETPIREPFLRPKDNEIRKDFWPLLTQKSAKSSPDGLPHCSRCDVVIVTPELKDEDTDSFDDFIASDGSVPEMEGVVTAEVGLIDHRRPILQGGGDDISNLQLFCRTCNNLKGTVCRKCPYGGRCNTCDWAFPERYSERRVILFLDQASAETLQQQFSGCTTDEAVKRLIQDYLAEYNT